MELGGNGVGTENRWIFAQERLDDARKRLAAAASAATSGDERETRQSLSAAVFIQEMGDKLQLKPLAINTAIVYMRRFAIFHPVADAVLPPHVQARERLVLRHTLAAACIFLSAKVEEQPRKLDHVVRTAAYLKQRLHLQQNTELYYQKTQELLTVENVLLQVLGFDIAVDHAHPYVVKLCVHKVPKVFANKAYANCTNSLLLTDFCLRFPARIVALVCIMLTSFELKLNFPMDGDWQELLSPGFTQETLTDLCREFGDILSRAPTKFRRPIDGPIRNPTSATPAPSFPSHIRLPSPVTAPLVAAHPVVLSGGAHAIVSASGVTQLPVILCSSEKEQLNPRRRLISSLAPNRKSATNLVAVDANASYVPVVVSRQDLAAESKRESRKRASTGQLQLAHHRQMLSHHQMILEQTQRDYCDEKRQKLAAAAVAAAATNTLSQFRPAMSGVSVSSSATALLDAASLFPLAETTTKTFDANPKLSQCAFNDLSNAIIPPAWSQVPTPSSRNLRLLTTSKPVENTHRFPNSAISHSTGVSSIQLVRGHAGVIVENLTTLESESQQPLRQPASLTSTQSAVSLDSALFQALGPQYSAPAVSGELQGVVGAPQIFHYAP